MTTPAEEQVGTGRPRRRYRLSVQAVMAVVLILAVLLGWFVRRAQVQREAVAAIEKSGGQVVYYWQKTPAATTAVTNLKAAPPGRDGWSAT